MSISPALRVCIAHISVFTMLACSMPMRVKRINSVNEPAKGIRYIVKRPGYEVGIRFDDSEFTQLNDNSVIERETESCFSDIRNPEFDVNVAQNLSGTPLTYEVTSPSGLAALPHIFSDTRMTITTEADGTLLALSSGETDKSLEFIQAVAGLAITAARKKAGNKSDPNYCAMLKRADFKSYVRDHLALLLLKKSLTNQLTQIQLNLGALPLSVLGESLRVIELLRSELSKINESIRTIQYELPKEYYLLTVDRKQLTNPTNAWLDINLTK